MPTLMSCMQGNVIVESILASAVSDADIVLEAVIEDVQVKTKLFKGDLIHSHILLCQNAIEYACDRVSYSIEEGDRSVLHLRDCIFGPF